MQDRNKSYAKYVLQYMRINEAFHFFFHFSLFDAHFIYRQRKELNLVVKIIVVFITKNIKNTRAKTYEDYFTLILSIDFVSMLDYY